MDKVTLKQIQCLCCSMIHFWNSVHWYKSQSCEAHYFSFKFYFVHSLSTLLPFLTSSTMSLLPSLFISLGLGNCDHWLKVKSGNKEIFVSLSDLVGKDWCLFYQCLFFKLKCILWMNFQVMICLVSFIRISLNIFFNQTKLLQEILPRLSDIFRKAL